MICHSRAFEAFENEQDESDDVGYVTPLDFDVPIDFDTSIVQILPEAAAEISSLKSRVAELEAIVSELCRFGLDNRVVNACEPTNVEPCVAEVIELTEAMFGTVEIAVESEADEIDESVVVLTVRPVGEASELVRNRIEWHKKIRQIKPGNSGSFRLSIVPRE